LNLTRTSLRAQIREILLARILKGEYKPGDRIVELQVAQEFGTSQAPVRESLRELEALGFVFTEPYRGTYVKEVKKASLAEVYPVRAALEEVAARAAAKNLAGNIAALEQAFKAMQAAAVVGNLAEEVHLDAEFHRLIVEASGNHLLLELWTSLRIEERTMISVLASTIDPIELAELHRPILEALTRGDGEQAGQLVRAHIEYFGELILNNYQDQDSR
jgi:DNA-binding GntR family transcriptional regulator